MADDKILNEPFSATDIVFNCGACGKSLVIDVLGAGLAITCPDCGAELQVPTPPGDGEAASPESESVSVAAGTGKEQVDRELPDISDVLADAHEQINTLQLENDELQFRNRYLEKHYALTSQSVQSLRQEIAMIRTELDQMDEILQNMEDPSAGDTQPIA